MKNFPIVLLFLFFVHGFTQAQTSSRPPLTNRVAVVFGLTQPLLVGGFNIEGNLFYRRLVVDYSHGASLDFAGSSVTGELKEQQLAVHMPYSTGFGVGYRFNEWLNLRVEPKWHRFQVYYDGDAQIESNRIVDYRTFSLGLGAYANLRPFKNSGNLLRGIMVAPSFRFWPTLASSLTDGEFSYVNERTEQAAVHRRMEPGIGNTPWIVNVSVGYSVAF